MGKFEIYDKGRLRRSHAYEDETVTVPNGVASICDGAFRFHHMKTLVMPEGVKSIVDDACDECRELENVVFPHSLREIGRHVFTRCGSLKSVTLPSELTKLGSDAFNGSGLEKIFLPRSVKRFDGAFSGCNALKRAEIEDGITRVDSSAFNGCASLVEVVLPASVVKIGSYAFRNCSSLARIVLPDGLKEIGSRAFAGCTSLEEIAVPDSVTKIGGYAFDGCKNLKRIKIRAGIVLGVNALRGCEGLPSELVERTKPEKKATIPPEIVEVATEREAFDFRDEKTLAGMKGGNARYIRIIVPDGVRTIGGGAFRGLNVREIVLPDGLETIRAGAFENCVNFKRVYIPKSVKTVERNAFAGCKQLKIYCGGSPGDGWTDLPDEKKTYYDDMTEAFDFHRSAGSFDDRYIVERTEIIRNSYNPEKRPVYTDVSREEFLSL